MLVLMILPVSSLRICNAAGSSFQKEERDKCFPFQSSILFKKAPVVTFSIEVEAIRSRLGSIVRKLALPVISQLTLNKNKACEDMLTFSSFVGAFKELKNFFSPTINPTSDTDIESFQVELFLNGGFADIPPFRPSPILPLISQAILKRQKVDNSSGLISSEVGTTNEE